MTTFEENEFDKAFAKAVPTTQESARRRFPIDPHRQDRRDAKAAVSNLRCVQQYLEEYRLSVRGIYEADRRIEDSITPGYDMIVAKWRAISHPGERATASFRIVLEAWVKTTDLLRSEHIKADIERRMELGDYSEFVAIAVPDRSRRIQASL